MPIPRMAIGNMERAISFVRPANKNSNTSFGIIKAQRLHGISTRNVIKSIEERLLEIAYLSFFAQTSEREGRILFPNIAVSVGISPTIVNAKPE